MRFKTFLPVGNPRISAQHFDSWGADEIALLDISPDRRNQGPNLGLIREISATCRTPLLYGGGISSVDQVRSVVRSGADKVAIGAAALQDPAIIEEAAHYFGRQCIVGVLGHPRGMRMGLPCGATAALCMTARHPWNTPKKLVARGAGELLLNSVDKDGTRSGMDLDTIARIAQSVSVPIIACGGVGAAGDIAGAAAIDGVQAVAVGNVLNFSEHSITVLKAALSDAGTPMRHDTYADYRGRSISELGRVEKRPDRELRDLIFIKHPEETI